MNQNAWILKESNLLYLRTAALHPYNIVWSLELPDQSIVIVFNAAWNLILHDQPLVTKLEIALETKCRRSTHRGHLLQSEEDNNWILRNLGAWPLQLGVKPP